MLTRDDVFSYMAELVELWQNTSPVVRSKPEKEPVIKKVMQHWWKDLRLLIEGGKIAGEDWQSVVTRLQTVVNTASTYVPIISALTPPKFEDQEAQSSFQASSSAFSAPRLTGQRRPREQAAPVASGFKDIKIVCQDCSTEFPFSAGQQEDFQRRKHELPKRCKDCVIAKKQRFASYDNSSSQDKPKAGMPEDSQAQASSGSGGWGSGGASGGSDGWGGGKGGKGKGGKGK